MKLFLSGGCEDMDILWAFFTNSSIESIYLSFELREKLPYLQNYHSIFFFNTARSLIITKVKCGHVWNALWIN